MSQDALERAIRVSIRNAFNAGRLSQGEAALQTAINYAIGLIVPVSAQLIGEAVREAAASVGDQKELSL